MSDKCTNWTEQQNRAIVARGSDVLVTASAGTGKTAVLSGRCVDILADRRLCPDVSAILVLTFTDAAAEQMRYRIAGQLKAAFLAGEDAHLRRQLTLLQGADISTIHSFCKRLITEYFYKLGMDPTFSVMDADESALLKTEVLDRTVDWAWKQANLAAGLEQLLRGRDLRTNDGFLGTVIWLSGFLDSVASRRSWYERAARLAEIADPSTCGLGDKQKRIVASRLRDILGQLRHAVRIYESNSAGGAWGATFEDSAIRQVASSLEALESGDWDGCAEQIRNFRKPRFSRPKELEADLGDLIHRLHGKALESFARLSELAVLNPSYLDELAGAVSLQTGVLIELVRRFDLFYEEAKRAINGLDFADLEHHALRLLAEPGDSADRLEPTETALALRGRYKYIFVDEYQDINPVQQAILDALSSGGNVFVVGDVKQSIYAWRGAEPQIFLDRLKPASTEPGGAINGLRVDLNANFRSNKGILDFVNALFCRIMRSTRLGGVDYDESARLRPGLERQSASCPGEGRHVVEFHILDEASLEDEEQEGDGAGEQGGSAEDDELSVVNSRQRQAALIARRIREMVGADTGRAEFEVYDGEEGQMRPVGYGDIVILMRSPAKKANEYVQVLRLGGIPVNCESAAGYFETTEISDMLSLLKVLDNPQRDIELAAVLRSPLFRISDTELGEIRMHGNEGHHRRSFHDCLMRYCLSGPDDCLAGRLSEIVAQIEEWRTLARRGSPADLMWRIYRRTDYLSFVSALPNGRARRANLLKLHDRAIQYEGFVGSGTIPSLSRFVEFIEKLEDTGRDWAAAEPDAAAADAVRILSIHKSKGLEFPVVFLAELESRFNMADIRADCLADAENTIGLRIIDRESNTRLRSLAHEVIAEHRLETSLAEEMRILYVGATRAKDRLILTASQKHGSCRRILSSGLSFGEEGICDWQLRSCRSPLEWVLYGLSDRKVLHDAFDTGLEAGAREDGLFGFELHGRSSLMRLSDFVVRLKSGRSGLAHRPGGKGLAGRKGERLFVRVKESLSRRYRFGSATVLPAKSSVTQWTHRDDEYVRFDYSRAVERRPACMEGAGAAEPRVLGTAVHLVICRLDLGRPVTKSAIERVGDELLAEEAITAAVAREIDAESILSFFRCELGRIVLDAPENVRREWPFTFAMPASERIGSSGDSEGDKEETVIVQGIIDMLVSTPQGLIVIDFKTDNITAGEASARRKVYRGQIDLYARAASAILNSQTASRWLYFLRPHLAVEVIQ